ncbi:MAG: hypothetical protein QM790_01810 [Nibricoccus sp.]
MKESRFIELLNLYVDQQLTAAEATELETELQRNPSRRRTYQQYCRMQKGCAQLFEQERQSAPATSKLSRALADADRKVVAFPNERSYWWRRGVYATGVAAVAACVAVMLVRQAPTPGARQEISRPASGSAVAVSEPAPAPAAVQNVAIPPADPSTREMRKLYYSVVPVRQFVPVKVVSTNDQQLSEQDKLDFAWMKKVELAPMRPVSAEELMAEANNRIHQPAATFLKSQQPEQQSGSDTEMVAFGVQKGN